MPHGRSDPAESEHLSERKIDACGAGQGMLPVPERCDAVIDETCGTAPHGDITAFEAQAAHRIGAASSDPQENGRQAKRDGDDRGPSILLVTVLMEAEFSARDVAVDEAGVGIVAGESGLRWPSSPAFSPATSPRVRPSRCSWCRSWWR